MSPAGNVQWMPINPDGTPGPDIMMLTSDLALSVDPHYMSIAKEYAENQLVLEKDFAASWYKLVTVSTVKWRTD